MKNVILKFANFCEKFGAKLIGFSLLTTLIFYFTSRTLAGYSVMALCVGIVIITSGVFIELSLTSKPSRSKPKSGEDLDAHGSALAKGSITEFDSKYG